MGSIPIPATNYGTVAEWLKQSPAERFVKSSNLFGASDIGLYVDRLRHHPFKMDLVGPIPT